MFTSLRSRIALGLLFYSLILGGVILTSGHIYNERIEAMIWREMLIAEFDRLVEIGAGQPDVDADTHLKIYFDPPETNGSSSTAPPPDFLIGLPEGIHDEIEVSEDEEYAVMVRKDDSRTIYAVLNIDDLELAEQNDNLGIAAFWVAASATLCGIIWWLSGRLVWPVTRLVASIDRISPDRGTTNRVETSGRAYDEIDSIASSLNRLLDRIDEDLARELEFLNTASHELRTPITVISGAVELLRRPELPEELRPAVERIRQTTVQTEQLIWTLLMLARSPERVREASAEFDLAELITEVIEDHESMLPEKSLSVVVPLKESAKVFAPIRLAQIAVANLLRNAIENSDGGTITIKTSADGVVTISDPGHGMSDDDIGDLYSRMAKTRSRAISKGIGLELITRICKHMHWQLTFSSELGEGTVARLSFSDQTAG